MTGGPGVKEPAKGISKKCSKNEFFGPALGGPTICGHALCLISFRAIELHAILVEQIIEEKLDRPPMVGRSIVVVHPEGAIRQVDPSTAHEIPYPFSVRDGQHLTPDLLLVDEPRTCFPEIPRRILFHNAKLMEVPRLCDSH